MEFLILVYLCLEIHSTLPDDPGVYPYFCMVHPWMIGEIVVVESQTLSSTSESKALTEPFYNYSLIKLY